MCENSERWVFTLAEPFIWHHAPPVAEDAAFQDKTGVTRLILQRPSTVIVTEGYAWDGCTPKVCVFDVLVGTPDGVIDSRTKQPKAYHASLVHDAFYQFLADDLPFTRAQADGCFLRLLEETGFKPRRIYWLAVRTLGWLFVLHHRYKRQNRGQKVALPAVAGLRV
jgi:hypothetical protein